ncbi:MAG: hypothetical protein IS632_09195 [Thaumarchaeota archaeon]|nr:hypothetical protein [Nitrososphaerota archaeon]
MLLPALRGRAIAAPAIPGASFGPGILGLIGECHIGEVRRPDSLLLFRRAPQVCHTSERRLERAEIHRGPAVRNLRGYPGATIRQPARRRLDSDRQTGRLAADDLALNKEINGTRIVVEHAIGMIKLYRVTAKPCRGTPKELNGELNIISGLVNLNIDWDRTKEENGFPVQKLAKGMTLTAGWPGATRHTKALHTAVLLGCARPSVSGVSRACRVPTKAIPIMAAPRPD